ncbi:valine--tRNA ligase [candidate division Kazan bacterium RBG_13_50_9]|uniref:Valine--tRNA ligase n=1 Tax=candidate division Kazan bacterium RBG_13_50_9 TaxID=1798535 RepID=A0A1F4NS14_UNCK3|nr:MAG: valine--tRNA ligase [candidate division Kazan bacterium RBG_13_50_9]
MDTVFKPQEAEQKIYRAWEESGLFTPNIDKNKKPYVITMPPPNAYDQLHIGHALFVTLEDIMIRYHRLRGEPTLWLPGADHAGIASQVFFEKILKKEEGKTRYDLGRAEFVKRLREFVLDKRAVMENQLKRLGASCDWTRKKFTLDPDVSEAVYHIFKKMCEEGLIYRGERIINWCPRCATGLSDLEVEHQETEGQLTYIKYPLEDGSGFVTVATTRPETMLGDTAVAVNPKDKRFKDLIGKTLILPLMERAIPIIADDIVDIKFGTGAVKVTPAHDLTDFEIGARHKLGSIVVIGLDATMTDKAGKYKGLTVLDAREKVLEDLRTAGLVEKQTKHSHNVGHCEKCKAVVEPVVSKQWFVKIGPLAKPAIEAVKSGKIRFIPRRFEKVYFNWMENIRDWNISRQLWWGHRIPVYYLKNDKTKFAVAKSAKDAEKWLGGPVEQDEDTLDTWFSSGLWPFTTLGWPQETSDFKYFYPTTVMETGWDILFFWVARMIMLGIYCTGETPFELVYLNGLVRDKEGNKISKSKGNVIDPIDMIDKYGADALRMGLVMGTAAGNDTSVSEDKIRAYRNFANKVWNAARFISIKSPKVKEISEVKLNPADKKMVDEFKKVVKKVTAHLDRYQIALAGEILYQYFWHRFCDECIEEAKPRLEDRAFYDSTAAALHHILRDSLVMLHPFVPFATEAAWRAVYEREGLLLGQRWPK